MLISVCIFLKSCPSVLQGNLSFSCVEPYTVPVFFNATSYLEVPGRLNQDLFSVSFQFRTWNPNGLLLFSHFADNLGNVEIDLTESKVGVHINITQTKMSQIDISSGQWNLFHVRSLNCSCDFHRQGDVFVLWAYHVRDCLGSDFCGTFSVALSSDWIREI